ncbi:MULTISPECIES: glutathione-disulfide reductase [unclassified Undibacterium]|uniref:glutathione-disulfide reductase n=2 Tax=Bacteria TaxID=2 RepID=UPI002AC9321D|nr:MULTISPECIES: glutathione-disulfide reductase [unclassified Undibacterium]MEB0138754.1 glutathione-disulfide reductase [Undibacterium sp. CCC2.1]MEB0171555.1 glutathione-disulfide reductase [Undibacterium sp. CCC1.1]MEB0175374.1 glutathione-disulfide reductase [Undibacterium sp. CCC3.4]MEB0214755.1 glutathione-disulfide reductase [Undibacterium sp. 5I2]WPX43287.1 glutathione-disulfide reductase [Undibacterium sp. CCC3.4]
MNTEMFDLLVIGAGSGGVRAARMAAQKGARVGIIEGGDLGGTCVNVGCIPKKLYSYAAHYAESFNEAAGYGWSITEKPKLNWELLKANRRTEISRLNAVYANLLSNAGVVMISGWAKIINRNTVQVDGLAYHAKTILIATGGTPTVPHIAGAEHAITSNDIFDLAVFPKRLLVVGGGYIACEFASIFNGLGAQVTQLYRGEQILRGFDDDVRQFLAAEMRQAGVDLRLNTDVATIINSEDGLTVSLNNGQTIQVDTILYAIGRVPNIQGLGLPENGIEQSADGAIKVNEQYQTSVPGIYALGDVTARIQLTPVALGEAMALVDHLFGAQKMQMDYAFIPTAVFTHPNLATVGYSEAEARNKFKKIRVYRSEFKALKHTLSGSTERTMMKLIVDDLTDRVVGMHMVGADAGEIIQGFAVAMKAGATKAIFDSTIGIHPTAAEEFVTMRTALP